MRLRALNLSLLPLQCQKTRSLRQSFADQRLNIANLGADQAIETADFLVQLDSLLSENTLLNSQQILTCDENLHLTGERFGVGSVGTVRRQRSRKDDVRGIDLLGDQACFRAQAATMRPRE